MGATLSGQNHIYHGLDLQQYDYWSNDGISMECAVIYTVKGHSYPSSSCTFYYRATPDKVIIAMDDGLCGDNRVRVNIEICNFGVVKYKDSASRSYEERRRSNTNDEILYLAYEDSCRRRWDLFSLRRRILMEETCFSVHFLTGFARKEDRDGQDMEISCGYEKGIHVRFPGPYKLDRSVVFGTNRVSGMPPPDGVLEIVDNVRKELKIKVRNIVEATDHDDDDDDDGHHRRRKYIYNNKGNIIINSGKFEGDGTGQIVNGKKQSSDHIN